MPLIKVQTSMEAGAEVKEAVVKRLSAITAGGIGKPETYVAAVLEDNAVIAFGGEIGPSASVEVRSIGGLNGDVNNRLATEICDCLKEKLGIDPARVCINFFDIQATNWAWKGSTFG